MSDTISRQQAIDALKNDMASLDHIIQGMSGYDVRLDAYVSQRNQVNCDIDTISNLPPAQPEPCEDDPRADVYYLAEKIGINQLYELVVQLRGEPEPCEDAVSRQAAIDWLNDAVHEHNITDFDAVATILALPPVTPKQRTGKWIDTGGNEEWYAREYRCSECGDTMLGEANFCPNCGAKMMEGDAE